MNVSVVTALPDSNAMPGFVADPCSHAAGNTKEKEEKEEKEAQL
jgi:hypothetical protein